MSALVPENHLLPGIDPVVSVKMVLLQFVFGIRSMRLPWEEIEGNAAYKTPTILRQLLQDNFIPVMP